MNGRYVSSAWSADTVCRFSETVRNTYVKQDANTIQELPAPLLKREERMNMMNSKQKPKPAALVVRRNDKFYVELANVYDFKEDIKALGFWFDGSRKIWYTPNKRLLTREELVELLDYIKIPLKDVGLDEESDYEEPTEDEREIPL